MSRSRAAVCDDLLTLAAVGQHYGMVDSVTGEWQRIRQIYRTNTTAVSDDIAENQPSFFGHKEEPYKRNL